ncbi:MAG: Rossmann-like domain-containing protein [Gammaproteobacteria bacterium]
MSVIPDYLQLIDRIRATTTVPDIVRVHLPEPDPEDPYRDEFGFVILADGSVGPFYVCLDDTLARLSARLTERTDLAWNTLDMAARWAESDGATRALALGAWNAASQHLMDRAGYQRPARGTPMDVPQPEPGETIGMVGWFRPIIRRLEERGIRVRVVEKKPRRIVCGPDVEAANGPEDLAGCRIVICTASTLINDSLDDILPHCDPGACVQLIGPSASGLPDPLLARGVRTVGGAYFPDAQALLALLDGDSNWGPSALKYELTSDNYPGVDALLQRLGNNT